MSKLYSTIETLCKQQKINVTELCKQTKVSRAALSDLKQGRTKKLSSESLEKIAAYFGVTVNYLLQNTEIKPMLNELAMDGVTLMYDGAPIGEKTMEAFKASLEKAIAILEEEHGD